MIKKALHTLFLGLLVTSPIYAQTIETPANTALTVTSDITLPVNKGLLNRLQDIITLGPNHLKELKNKNYLRHFENTFIYTQ